MKLSVGDIIEGCASHPQDELPYGIVVATGRTSLGITKVRWLGSVCIDYYEYEVVRFLDSKRWKVVA